MITKLKILKLKNKGLDGVCDLWMDCFPFNTFHMVLLHEGKYKHVEGGQKSKLGFEVCKEINYSYFLKYVLEQGTI